MNGKSVTRKIENIFISLALALITATAVAEGASVIKKNNNNEWDVLIFTQTWPNTWCIDHHGHCLLPPKPVNVHWRIHGLWPTRLHTIGPSFCNQSLPFNLTALSPFMEQLEENWPNLMEGQTIDSLWRHEWLKHGTCAVSVPALSSEVKYFEKGLKLLEEFSMTKILSRDGLNPSNTPTIFLSQLNEAIFSAVKKRAIIVCSQITESNPHAYLFEVRLCFDKTLNLVDCDGVVGAMMTEGASQSNPILSNCPHNAPISYPESFKIDTTDNDKDKLYYLFTFLRLFYNYSGYISILGP